MAKYHGNIGFGVMTEKDDGIWDEDIVEREYYGDISRMANSFRDQEVVIPGLTMNNTFSVLADSYIFENLANIRYLIYMGVRWVVKDLEVRQPRLIIRVGGQYHGATPKGP